MSEDMEVIVKDVLARILEEKEVKEMLGFLHKGSGTATPMRVWLDAERLLEQLRSGK